MTGLKELMGIHRYGIEEVGLLLAEHTHAPCDVRLGPLATASSQLCACAASADPGARALPLQHGPLPPLLYTWQITSPVKWC